MQKVKLLVPAVAGSKRSLTYISSTNNSVESIFNKYKILDAKTG